jgi:hypothetical protein
MMEERFKTFSTHENVSACRREAVPKNTRKGVNVYKFWERSLEVSEKDETCWLNINSVEDKSCEIMFSDSDISDILY